jgi:5-deoxy-glucuronate isomerase
MSNWYKPAGSLKTAEHEISLSPQDSGWEYCGFYTYNVATKSEFSVELSNREGVLLPLSAQNVSVLVDGQAFTLKGRTGVFAAVSDWIYLPVGSKVSFSGKSGEIALLTAQASEKFPVCYTPAEQVQVEVRGSGKATRQVNNIATPTSFTQCHKILVCEVLTPGGNLSSWPPHRHDKFPGCPTINEEVYYFQIGKEGSDHGDPEGVGFFHVYTVDETVDETVTLHDRDTYVVPHGYHGPSIASPEYPMYFLNVMAGPAPERSMAFCDDPAHHWIRDSWNDQVQDPRCPMTSANGKVWKG